MVVFGKEVKTVNGITTETSIVHGFYLEDNIGNRYWYGRTDDKQALKELAESRGVSTLKTDQCLGIDIYGNLKWRGIQVESLPL